MDKIHKIAKLTKKRSLRDWLVYFRMVQGGMLDSLRHLVRAYPVHFRFIKTLVARSFGKLRWRRLRSSPVVLLTVVAALIATISALLNWYHGTTNRLDVGVSLWLWLAIWPSLLLESAVEERGRTELAKLQPSRHKLYVQRARATKAGDAREMAAIDGAMRIADAVDDGRTSAIPETEVVALERITPGDTIVVGDGMLIPVDGRVIGGIARLDESMLSGETELVVRDAMENSTIMAGARVVSGQLRIRVIKVAPEYLAEGAGGIDGTDGADEILMVERAGGLFTWPSAAARGVGDTGGGKSGVNGGSTNGVSGVGGASGASSVGGGRGDFLENILAIYAISVLLAVVALAMMLQRAGTPLPLNVLIALWSCLVPTTVSALLPSIRMIGMLKLLRRRVVTLNGKALETAGEVEAVYFDKTGTVTCGYLTVTAFYPLAVGSLERLMRLVVLVMQKDCSAEAKSAVQAATQWLRKYYYCGCGNSDKEAKFGNWTERDIAMAGDNKERRDDGAGDLIGVCDNGSWLDLQAALAVPADARYLAIDEKSRLGGVDLLAGRWSDDIASWSNGGGAGGGCANDSNDDSYYKGVACSKCGGCSDYSDCGDSVCHRLRWGPLNLVRNFCPAGYEAALADGALQQTLKELTEAGDSAIAIADQERLYGIIRLHDKLKAGMEDLPRRLVKLGIDSALISGDGALTTAQTAKMMHMLEQLPAARPEIKARKILEQQERGRVVAMVGDGLNDVPALQQADLAIVMNAGSAQARRWADMVDLDSDPRRLLDIVRIGRQTLLMRGALTTFSLVNDAVKCVIVLPIILLQSYPALAAFNFLRLQTLASATLAALTFNALIIPCSLLLAFWRTKRTQPSIAHLLRQNVQYFGTLGVLLPVIAIKLLEYLYL